MNDEYGDAPECYLCNGDIIPGQGGWCDIGWGHWTIAHYDAKFCVEARWVDAHDPSRFAPMTTAALVAAIQRWASAPNN